MKGKKRKKRVEIKKKSETVKKKKSRGEIFRALGNKMLCLY